MYLELRITIKFYFTHYHPGFFPANRQFVTDCFIRPSVRSGAMRARYNDTTSLRWK